MLTFGKQLWSWFHAGTSLPKFGTEIFVLTAGCIQRAYPGTAIATISGASLRMTLYSSAHTQEAAQTYPRVDDLVRWFESF